MSTLIKAGAASAPEDLEMLALDAFLEADDKSQAVWLDADQEVERISEHLENIAVIGLNFPAFSDGRSYSNATMLRRHYGYAGEIRAIGDVRIDQLEQMARCGFDAFVLADGQDAERALEKLSGYSFSYQQTVDRAPLFRKRS